MMKSNKLKILLCALCLLELPLAGLSQTELKRLFETPVGESKPWTFWYWMYGAVSRQGIKADLEAMKNVGLGGAYLMPIRSSDFRPEYKGTADQLSPEWWDMVRFSVEEADRLGLQLGVHISDGFALAGGPWITPEESMQKVVWTETFVEGGNVSVDLPQPEAVRGYYKDIALYALPVLRSIDNSKPEISVHNLDKQPENPDKVVNMSADGIIRSSYPCYIQFEYDHPFTCTGVEIILSGNNYQAHRLKVTASMDGVEYKEVKQLEPARHGWQNTDENTTYSLPPVTARYYRFYWTPEGSEPGSEDLDAAKWKANLKIKQLKLLSDVRLNSYEGKTGLVWRVAADTKSDEVNDACCVPAGDVIDLTSRMLGGKVMATLPKGKWRLLRMGHTSTGHENATGGAGKGLECDKFSDKAVRKQLENWFGEFFNEINPELSRRVLKFMHVDSWECGSQNWSDNFAAEFKLRRGYDLMPYMPLFAGIPMDSAERSEQILRDVRITISELVNDVFYKELAACARKYQCELSAECVAPTMVSDGLLHYSRVDRPMGEFWLNSPTHDKPNDMLDAVSGAHIYGKKIIQAEGFTEVRGVWDEYPGMIKPLLDRNYALGINKLFFHIYVHNPWLDRKPGMTLDGIGLFFQRDQTWWKEGKAFVDYIARCQALLQYGEPVVDIAVFTGEEVPRRAMLPDRLVPMLPGIFGEERVESEKKRLANVGQPTRIRPVGVSHSANMADPEEWVNPLRGYAYDSFNKDALLRLAEVDDGYMVLPGGARYKVLVIPGAHPMDPNGLALSEEARKKVDELKSGGVFVPDLPYLSDDFSVVGLDKDIELPEDVAYTHRSGDEADIYFLANQQKQKREFVASFRINGRVPQLWDPVTGKITQIDFWEEKDGRTEVKLNLSSYASIFVVFAKEPVEADELTFVERTVPLEVKEWSVYFENTGKEIVTDTLFNWTDSHDDQIRYYSGRAIYTTDFRCSKLVDKDRRIMLDIGQIDNLGTVRLNGKECGVVWTFPYQVDVTDMLKKGRNRLEIEVVNTWANALRGADEGKAPFDGIWTNAKYRRAEKTLLPAGLVGPLTLEYRYIKRNIR